MWKILEILDSEERKPKSSEISYSNLFNIKNDAPYQETPLA